MLARNLPLAHAGRPGCLDVGLVARNPGLFAKEPGSIGPARQAQADDERPCAQASAQGGDGGQGYKQRGQRERGADRDVRPPARRAARPAGNDAGQRAQTQANDGNQADQGKGGSNRPQQLAQDIAAKSVAAQRETLGGEWRKRGFDRSVAHKGNVVELERIARRDERARHGHGQTERAQDRPNLQGNVPRRSHGSSGSLCVRGSRRSEANALAASMMTNRPASTAKRPATRGG